MGWGTNTCPSLWCYLVLDKFKACQCSNPMRNHHIGNPGRHLVPPLSNRPVIAHPPHITQIHWRGESKKELREANNQSCLKVQKPQAWKQTGTSDSSTGTCNATCARIGHLVAIYQIMCVCVYMYMHILISRYIKYVCAYLQGRSHMSEA